MECELVEKNHIMKTHRPSLPLLAALIAVVTTSPLHAVTAIYSTDFNSPTYGDGGIIGQDGWILSNSVTNPINVANTATNGTVSLTTSGQDIRRVFTPTISTGSAYLKADITVGSAQSGGDYFLHLSDGGTSNLLARVYIKSSGAGFVMALGTSSGTSGLIYGSTELNFTTPYTLLARYDFVAGAANDTGALFINPTTDDGSGDAPYVPATTTGTDATVIGGIGLRQGTASTAPTVIVDNLVVSIPEPSTALLGTLGLLGLLRRRRSN